LARGGSRLAGLRLAALLALLLLPGLGPSRASSPAPRGAEAAPRRVAVLPLHALNPGDFPARRIESLLRYELDRLGLRVVPEPALESFLRKHRIRWTGGLGRETAALFEAELGVDTVLVTSLDDYDEGPPPRIALTSRLVSTGPDPLILWMDASHRAGNQAPGFLELGLVDDPGLVAEKAVRALGDSLARHLEGRELRRPPWGTRGALGPKRESGSSEAVAGAAGDSRRVAVLPFLNESARLYAGEILTLQVVRQLAAAGTVELYEPGVVREVLLQVRLIQEDGLSLAQVDMLQALLPLDVVVTGRVAEYRDSLGEGDLPEVGFSLRVIDAATRQAVWSSVSYNRGRDGVFFFNSGRLYTAHELAFEMTRSAVQVMTRWTARSVKRMRRSLESERGRAPSS
jgi:hypothetical protein